MVNIYLPSYEPWNPLRYQTLFSDFLETRLDDMILLYANLIDVNIELSKDILVADNIRNAG